MNSGYDRDTAIHMASCFRNAGFPDFAQETLNNLKEELV